MPPIALGVGQGELLGLAGGVLVDGDQRRDAAAVLEGAPHQVAGALGGDHPHVDALGRGDLAEVDVEPVGEGDGVAVAQVGLDGLLVDPGLLGVGQQHHDHVGLVARLADLEDLEPGRLGLGEGGRALPQPHPDVDAGRAQVEGVGVALGPVAEHGDLLTSMRERSASSS